MWAEHRHGEKENGTQSGILLKFPVSKPFRSQPFLLLLSPDERVRGRSSRMSSIDSPLHMDKKSIAADPCRCNFQICLLILTDPRTRVPMLMAIQFCREQGVTTEER